MSKYQIKIDGKIYEMEIERMDGAVEGSNASKAAPKQENQVCAASPSAVPVTNRTPISGNGAVMSPMPGTVNKVFVSQGETVKAGQAVLILEAMKMENEITAPKAGRVTVLNASEGQNVQGGTLLFEIGE